MQLKELRGETVDGLPVVNETMVAEQAHGEDNADGEPMEGKNADENEDLDGVPLYVPVASILAATEVQVNEEAEEGTVAFL